MVASIEPILSRWRKNVEVERVFQSNGGMDHIGWNLKDVAGLKNDFFSIHFKLQRTLKYIRDLFILMVMRRNDAPFFQNEFGEHDPVACDDLSCQQWIKLFCGDVRPPIFCHFPTMCFFHLTSFIY